MRLFPTLLCLSLLAGCQAAPGLICVFTEPITIIDGKAGGWCQRRILAERFCEGDGATLGDVGFQSLECCARWERWEGGKCVDAR